MRALEVSKEAVRLLLVEDSPGDAGIVQQALSRAQSGFFEVTWVRSLAAARECLSREAYDMVMLDLALPDSAGLETLQHVLANTKETPIVVTTGDTDVEIGLQALRAGAQEFVVKGSVSGEMLVRSIIYAMQRFQYAAELKRYRDHLTDLVDQRTRALREALSRLQVVDQARSEFVSNVSHELKTPLTSIRFALQNLLGGAVGAISEPVRSYLLMIEDDCRRLRGTVADILDMTRVDANCLELNCAQVSAEALVRALVASLQRNAEARGVALTFRWEGTDAQPYCDGQKIERAITNVVENAMKFTPRGGQVEVCGSICAHNAAQVCVRVIDNGIGIAPEHLPHVTERYFRVGKHIDGTGLGLAIASELLAHHGGALRLKSPPDGRERGTQVDIMLPLGAGGGSGIP